MSEYKLIFQPYFWSSNNLLIKKRSGGAEIKEKKNIFFEFNMSQGLFPV